VLLAVLALLVVVRPAKPELSTAPQMRPKSSPQLRIAAAARARWLVWFPRNVDELTLGSEGAPPWRKPGDAVGEEKGTRGS
jgi:hypothetical protein